MTKKDIEEQELALLRTYNWANYGMAPSGRTLAELDQDNRFLIAYIDAVKNATLDPVLSKSFSYHPGGRLCVWTGDDFRTVNIPQGIYERSALKAAISAETIPTPAVYNGLLYSLCQDMEREKPINYIMLTEGGQYVSVENPAGFDENVIPLYYGGLVYKFENNQLVLQRSLTTAEFEQHYPQIVTHGTPASYYYSSLLAKETAPMWNLAPAVLEDFKARLSLYKVVEIIAVVPVWIRTWGMSGDANGQVRRTFYRHIKAPYKHSGTLLRDELVWRVHFKLAGKIIPGVVHFTPPEDGARLVISDWCYRETPEGVAEAEMYHGHHNKLDILAWMAGPASDRFLGQERNNSKFKFKPAFAAMPQISDLLWNAMVASLDTATPVNTVEELNSVIEKSGGRCNVLNYGNIYEIKGPVSARSNAVTAHLIRYLKKGTPEAMYATDVNILLPLVVVPDSAANLVWKPTPKPVTVEAK